MRKNPQFSTAFARHHPHTSPQTPLKRPHTPPQIGLKKLIFQIRPPMPKHIATDSSGCIRTRTLTRPPVRTPQKGAVIPNAVRDLRLFLIPQNTGAHCDIPAVPRASWKTTTRIDFLLGRWRNFFLSRSAKARTAHPHQRRNEHPQSPGPATAPIADVDFCHLL